MRQVCSEEACREATSRVPKAHLAALVPSTSIPSIRDERSALLCSAKANTKHLLVQSPISVEMRFQNLSPTEVKAFQFAILQVNFP